MTRTDSELEQAAADADAWLETLDPSTVPATDTSDLAEVAAAMDAVASSNSRLRVAVQTARENGRSWSRIAMVLGTTKQSAHERFGAVSGTTPSRARAPRRAGKKKPVRRATSASSGKATDTGPARKSNAVKPVIAVEPRPGGKWAVQKQGARRALRITDRKSEAVTAARAEARREKSRLIIKDRKT